MDSQKEAFVSRVRTESHRLMEAISDAIELRSVYFDRTYNDDGANEITDADLSGLDIDAVDIASFVTAMEHLENWRDNASVTTGDYGAKLNVTRAL